MKKSLLIVSHAMELGGAERSLIGLLDALDPSQWDVDLFLLRHEGELLNAIPPHVNLLPAVSAYTVPARPMAETLKEGHLLLTAARLAGRIAAGRYAKKHSHKDSGVGLEYSHKYTCPLMPAIQPKKQYDLAISYLTPHYYVAKKVRAKKKLAWIHTDYRQIQINRKSESKMWAAYDRIISISEAVSKGFTTVFPELKDKLFYFENILPGRLIQQQAEEVVCDFSGEADESVLLSVGRFCKAKNFDNVPEICSLLLREGLKVKWYLIGFGGDESLIRQKITEMSMEEHVILLGKKANPYPYIKRCDLYVQPSRYEGKAVTVLEAQMLAKPVVITRYATSASQLEEGVDGMIAPLDNANCAKSIAMLLRSPERMEQLSRNCRERDYSNSSQVYKLAELIE